MAEQVRSGQAGSDHDNVRTGNVRSRVRRLGQLNVRTSQIISRQDRPRTGQAMLDLFMSGPVVRKDEGQVRTGLVK